MLRSGGGNPVTQLLRREEPGSRARHRRPATRVGGDRYTSSSSASSLVVRPVTAEGDPPWCQPADTPGRHICGTLTATAQVCPDRSKSGINGIRSVASDLPAKQHVSTIERQRRKMRVPRFWPAGMAALDQRLRWSSLMPLESGINDDVYAMIVFDDDAQETPYAPRASYVAHARTAVSRPESAPARR